MPHDCLMNKFRLPRKIKKKLKRTIYLYPPDKDGNSLMAFPTRDEKDYIALKQGTVKNILERGRNRQEKKEFFKMLDKEIIIPDEELKAYVDDIIREDLRNSFYNILIEAKKSPKAIIAYFNFVNAYKMYAEGNDSYGNICCLAVDKAKDLLKTKKKK